MICSLLRKMSRNSLKFVTLVFVGLTAVTISAVLPEDETSLRASGHLYDIYKKRLANFPKYDYEMDKLFEGRNKHNTENDIKLDKWNIGLEENQNAYLKKLGEQLGNGKRSIVMESLYDKFKERLNDVNGLMDENINNKCITNSNPNIDYMQRPERGFFSFYKKKPTSDIATANSKEKDLADMNSQLTVENDKVMSKSNGDNSLSAAKMNSSEKSHKTDVTTESNDAERKQLITDDKDLTASRHEMKRNTANNLYGINKMMPWEEIGARGYDYERSLMNNDLQDPKNYFIWQKSDRDEPTNDYSIERFINQCNMERYPGKPFKVMKRDIKNLNAINNADHCQLKKAVEQTLRSNTNKYSLYPRILETPPPLYKHYIPNNGSHILKQYAEQMNTTTLQAAKHVLSMNSTELGNQLKLMQQQQQQNKELKSSMKNPLNDTLEQQCKRNTKQRKSIMQGGIPSATLPTNQCAADNTKKKQPSITVDNKTAKL